MANDPYTDDEYDETYKEVHGDEPARDKYADDGATDSFFPSTAGRSLMPSGWGIWPSRDREPTRGAGSARDGAAGRDAADADRDGRRTDRAGERRTGRAGEGVSTDEDGGSWWDEGLITLLLVGGLALFLFPEPATSAVGLLMMGAGVVLGIVDWLL